MWHVSKTSSLYHDLQQHVYGYVNEIPVAFQSVHLAEKTSSTHGVKKIPEVEEGFPGLLATTMTREQIGLFYNGVRNYRFLAHYDGENILMGFVRIQGRPLVYLLDVAGEYHLCHASNIPSGLFDGSGSLLYVERASDRFHLFDLYAAAGKLLGHLSYLKRYAGLEYLWQEWCRLCVEPYSPTAGTTNPTSPSSSTRSRTKTYAPTIGPYTLQLKAPYTLFDIHQLWEYDICCIPIELPTVPGGPNAFVKRLFRCSTKRNFLLGIDNGQVTLWSLAESSSSAPPSSSLISFRHQLVRLYATLPVKITDRLSSDVSTYQEAKAKIIECAISAGVPLPRPLRIRRDRMLPDPMPNDVTFRDAFPFVVLDKKENE